ncbi:MAG: glycosyltransferase [Bacteroidetes bacterium]|nr:glycosyltransferase [Bacteroidota bacterium]
MTLLSLIIPCFNENKNLPALADALTKLRSQLPETIRLELVIIDDGSEDETASSARKLASEQVKIGDWQILKLSRNFGKEAALLAGLDNCSGDACVLMDADLQDPPELIPTLVKHWQNDAEVVNAVRSQRQGDSLLKQLSAFWFYRLFKATSHLDVRLDASDFRLLDRVVINAICACRERVRFSKGFIAWAGFRQVNVAYVRPSRKSGCSTWGLWKLWNYALDGLFSFSSAPLRVWTYIGFTIALLSVSYTVLIVLRALMGGINVPGYASIVAILTFLGGMQMIGIGLIGEYIGRIYLESKQRPIYLIRDHLKISSSSNSH